ncbi:UNVERIFIED_CONTAM: Amino acid permease 6 [Sesamum radiatum]|uniref:Amino acid permease 6 n=1 Tax=Sesamum radiatum TaxID=300843 RepID=A0AAW2SJ98_SESRA
MAKEYQKNSMYIAQPMESLETGHSSKSFDDDGRVKRTGTMLTASAHIITAVIGSGVLSLAWAIAQLGWVAGPAVLLAFSFITYFTSTLLADSYRCPGPVHGTRNYTYMGVVRSHLGGLKVQLCGLAQYGNLVGVTIGYTITASISMVAVKRSNCFHKNGHHVKCSISNYPFMAIFAGIQIILSQIPNFHELSWLSIVAAVMSFAYSSIGLGLSIAKVAGGGHVRTSLTGTTVGVDVSGPDKVWRSFQAIGDIAFAYAYSTVLIEIQATLSSFLYPPFAASGEQGDEESVFRGSHDHHHILCPLRLRGVRCVWEKTPGNFLTHEPFWLIDFANVCIAVHLIGAYQVSRLCSASESHYSQKYPDNKFITTEHAVNIPLLCGSYKINFFRLVWRTAYVVVTALVAMIFPFFNDFLGLIGAASFYPLTVYFPIEIYIAQNKIPKYSFSWMWLKILSWACLVVSVVAAAGSIQGLAQDVKTYKPFKTQ